MSTDVTLDGNRCEVCHGDNPAFRIERHAGPALWLCDACLPGWAARVAGIGARATTPAEESRLSEEVVASLQGQIAAMREQLGGHHRRLWDHETRLRAQEMNR